ncbi:MAG TPA: hypothetical protein PJ990_07160, partial [Saprospiraceae bacterium]|nr:hypothetical protein [Saprospiraceae bacterium]
MQPYKSISIAAHHHTDGMSKAQKLALTLVSIGFLLQMIFWLSFKSGGADMWLWSSLGLITLGSLGYTY